MIADVKVLESQIRQQRENVRVWEEGLKREQAKLDDMRNQLDEHRKILAAHGVNGDGGSV